MCVERQRNAYYLIGAPYKQSYDMQTTKEDLIKSFEENTTNIVELIQKGVDGHKDMTSEQKADLLSEVKNTLYMLKDIDAELKQLGL